MTIDKRMMTNFTLEALQNFNINQAVFDACMEEVEYDGVIEDEDGKTLRLRDAIDNTRIEISLDTDGDYRVWSDGDIMYADTFEQVLVKGLYLDAGGILPKVDKLVAQGVDSEPLDSDYDGVKLKYATTVGRYEDEFGYRLDRYGAEITGSGRDMDVHLKLDSEYGEYWQGYITNTATNEVIGYNTQNLKSILEDITKLQSEEARQAPFDKKKFNTPQRFDACIEEVQQSAQLFVCIFKLVYTNYPIIRDIHHP